MTKDIDEYTTVFVTKEQTIQLGTDKMWEPAKVTVSVTRKTQKGAEMITEGEIERIKGEVSEITSIVDEFLYNEIQILRKKKELRK